MGNCCGCCKKKKKPEPGAEVEPPKSEPVQVPPVVAQEVPEIRRSFPEIDLNASSDFKSPTGFQSVLKPARPKHLRVSPSVTSIALSPLPHTKYKKQSKEPSMIKDEEPKTLVSDGIGVQESDLENLMFPPALGCSGNVRRQKNAKLRKSRTTLQQQDSRTRNKCHSKERSSQC